MSILEKSFVRSDTLSINGISVLHEVEFRSVTVREFWSREISRWW